MLYADGVDTGRSVVLCADNSWKGVFDGLDKYTEGRLVVYSVGELNVPEGYTVSIENNTNTFTVTNTHVPEKKTKTIKFAWMVSGRSNGSYIYNFSKNNTNFIKINNQTNKTVQKNSNYRNNGHIA